MKISKGIVAEQKKQIEQLEEELHSYRSNTNPQMVSRLNTEIESLRREIRDLHKCCEQADGERDQAKEEAAQARKDFEELHQTYKTDTALLQEELFKMKEQHDKLLAYVKVIG